MPRALASGVVGRRIITLIPDGDSRTAGSLANGKYHDSLQPYLSDRGVIVGHNDGVSGARVADMITQAPTSIDPFRVIGALTIVTVWGAYNDWVFDTADAATIFSRLTTYCQARKAAGWNLVGVATEIATNGGAPYETVRNALNPLIRNGLATLGADFVIDLAADPTFGPATWRLDATLSYDGTHQTQLGCRLLANVFAAAIRARL